MCTDFHTVTTVGRTDFWVGQSRGREGLVRVEVEVLYGGVGWCRAL